MFTTPLFDGLVKSLILPFIDIPAKAAIQSYKLLMGSRSLIGVRDKLRGSDVNLDFLPGRLVWVKRNLRGVTLVELLVVVFILGTLTAIAMPVYTNQIEKARIAKAIAEVAIIGKEIGGYIGKESDGFLPKKLNDIGREDLLDPWGTPYQYLNFARTKGKGKKRKDRFMVPLNSDYDLYSKGKDGASVPPITAKSSQDDVIRANDGAFIGLASEY